MDEEQLREEFGKFYLQIGTESVEIPTTKYGFDYWQKEKARIIADYWIKRLHEHNKGIVEMIEGMKKYISGDIHEDVDTKQGYNNALEDIKNKLQNI